MAPKMEENRKSEGQGFPQSQRYEPIFLEENQEKKKMDLNQPVHWSFVKLPLYVSSTSKSCYSKSFLKTSGIKLNILCIYSNTCFINYTLDGNYYYNFQKSKSWDIIFTNLKYFTFKMRILHMAHTHTDHAKNKKKKNIIILVL